MFPAGVAALLIGLALVPGWVYLRLSSRLTPRAPTSGLDEVLEVLAVGLATTGIAVLVMVLVPHSWLRFALDVTAWASAEDGSVYLRNNFRPAVVSLAIVLVIALIAALLIRLAQGWFGRKPEFHPEGNVLVHALGTRPAGKVPWVGLRLKDGKLVEGILHSFSLDDLGDNREVALQPPIRVTDKGGAESRPVALDRLIIPFRQIDHIAVVHMDEATK